MTDQTTTAAPAANAPSGTAPATAETQTQTTPAAAAIETSQEVPGYAATEQQPTSEDAGAPQSDPAAGAAQTETEGDETAKRNKVSARERVEQATRRAREAEAERDRALQQLEKIQQSATARLDPLEYSTDAEYMHALVKQTADATRAEFLQQQAQAAHQHRQAAIAESWNERVDAFRNQAPDFEQVAYNAPISEMVAEAVAAVDAGPQVAYYLGKNPNEARRISSLPPLHAAVEIGRLNERLSVPLARKSTAAPPPPATIQGHGAPGQKRLDEMTMAEYAEARKAGRT